MTGVQMHRTPLGPGPERIGIRVLVQGEVRPVVEPRSSHLLGRHVEAERVDHVQGGANGHAQPGGVAGVWRNLGSVQGDVDGHVGASERWAGGPGACMLPPSVEPR